MHWECIEGIVDLDLFQKHGAALVNHAAYQPSGERAAGVHVAASGRDG
eukprot:CAMPEP_0180459698 /NCGR_PEP_ID=MMETSP1036_2-20121128/22988_1 /TAXON_ID=632150 /ORGANISM="Azadinium spinosum, Strain 3D9" /LENGTH=47 /DNA_ID= /DNA_START= /DNA_END= /DNA_ORIENTATION=